MDRDGLDVAISMALQEARQVMPQSRELSLTITKLEEAQMWAERAVRSGAQNPGPGDNGHPQAEGAESEPGGEAPA